MKLLLFLLFIMNTVFANESTNSLESLQNLHNVYSKYVLFSQTYPDNNKSIKVYEQLLITQKPQFTSVPLTGHKTFQTYELEFSRNLYADPKLSLEDKLYYAQIDLAKINAMLFLITNLNQFYDKNNKDYYNNFKMLFKNSEYKLLSLAKKALISPIPDAEILSTEFNLIIQKLSAFPFPPLYGFYRRRMLFTIDNPVAAQHEINRLTKSLQSLE